MAGLLIAGTSSDAGKSLVVTGLCRALARRGVNVAPFKAQNMSNNSMVCRDGSEIGRAQYLQAQAAGVEASSVHNPVLLKPGSDRESFVVVRGAPAGVLRAGEYATGRRHLAEAAFAAYDELAASVDCVIVEGAGSPAEINLRGGDYTNMGLATAKHLPVVVVGDIDRGGVLASLFGTWALVDDEDRRHLAGYIINKFRGDRDVLEPGLVNISTRTGLTNYGVLPWLDDVWLDSEDALSIGKWRHDVPDVHDLSVAVVRFPRTSNATDVDALAAEPGVRVSVTTEVDVCREADLLVLPGSRATVSDLAWLRRSGIADVVVQRHQLGRPVFGICGGYQMLAESIDDPIESGEGRCDGLGLLPAVVTFGVEKVLDRPSGMWRGAEVHGYEIHHGIVSGTDSSRTDHGDDIAEFPGGMICGATYGTIWHGTLECDDFRRVFLGQVARHRQLQWRPHSGAFAYRQRREQMIDRLADAVEKHCAVDEVIDLARSGLQAGERR